MTPNPNPNPGNPRL